VSVDTFPTGTAAAHPDWPLARFSVADMFLHYPLVMQYLTLMEKAFVSYNPIECLYGAPAMPWNGGRPIRILFKAEDFRAALEPLYSRNIGYHATFTSHLITANDLPDPVGNAILECISQHPDLNGVIVVSDLLSKYIADRYPAVQQAASIVKVTFEHGGGRPDYYRELGKRFHRYMIHPDDCRDLKILDQLDRDKAEIIVNEPCVTFCPARIHHYDTNARWQRAIATPDEPRLTKEADEVVGNCHSPFYMNRIAEHQRSCNLSRSEMKAVYDMGFRHFKLQGRADDPFSYSYDLTRFTLEPDFAAPLVNKSICLWLGHAVIRRGR